MLRKKKGNYLNLKYSVGIEEIRWEKRNKKKTQDTLVSEGSSGHMLVWVNSVPVVCWYKRTSTKPKKKMNRFVFQLRPNLKVLHGKAEQECQLPNNDQISAEKTVCGLLSFHRAFLHVCTRKVITVTNYFIVFVFIFVKMFCSIA